MGQVVPLVTPCSVDEAWEAYRAHAVRAHDDPTLGLDRSYVEKQIRLYRRFAHMIALDAIA